VPIEVNENTVRVRVADPGDFQDSSFRTIEIDAERGIKAVVGKRRGESSMSVQTYLFDRSRGWTAASATAWVERHGKTPMSTQSFADIQGVEIFEAGRHLGETWDEQDLDEMVRNFERAKERGVKPPLKLGHDEEQQFLRQGDGQPALGWVARLKRVGRKLLADFRDVPQALVNLIAKRRYARISSEIYRNFDGLGRTLAAVALLGADVPVVKTLEDLDKALASEEAWESWRALEGSGVVGAPLVREAAAYAEGTIGGVAINDLPDSSFAYIEPGGKKDEEGKTVPRSLRHFPIRRADGKPDPAHVRNALARAPQSPFGDKALPAIRKAAHELGMEGYGERTAADLLREAAAVLLRQAPGGSAARLGSVVFDEQGAPSELVLLVDGAPLRCGIIETEHGLTLVPRLSLAHGLQETKAMEEKDLASKAAKRGGNGDRGGKAQGR